MTDKPVSEPWCESCHRHMPPHTVHVRDQNGQRTVIIPDKPVSERASVEELRKAAHAKYHRHPVNPQEDARCFICKLADRLEEAERLNEEKAEIIKAIGHEIDEARAHANAADSRCRAAEYRAQRIVLDKKLRERAEKAERGVESLTAACRFALDEWFEPHYGTNDVGMAALVRDRLRAALRGDKT